MYERLWVFPFVKFLPIFLHKKHAAAAQPLRICLIFGFYSSTAPLLALVTSRAYRASQPDLMLGSGWT